MSAAATAAGYLYASGRLRGRNGREAEEAAKEEPKRDEAPRLKRRELKVAVYEPAEEMPPAAVTRPKTLPKILYRTRRWKPE
jgi:hypothetical protein